MTIGSFTGSTVMSDEISEASGFRFLFRDESPDRAVLEFDTATNPFGCCCQRSNWIA
jgi:hypothetical protein